MSIVLEAPCPGPCVIPSAKYNTPQFEFLVTNNGSLQNPPLRITQINSQINLNNIWELLFELKAELLKLVR